MKLRNKKTGEIADVKIDTYNENGKGNRICLSVKDDENLYRCIASYSSLAKLNEEWEDYEPHIEDKKVRKVVRAWAEACGVKKVTFYIFGEESEFWNNDNNNMSISFNCPLKLVEGRVYTIPELCGEEE